MTYFNIRNNIPYKVLIEKNLSGYGYTVQCFENDKMIATTVVDDVSVAHSIAESFVGSSEPQLLIG